LTEKKIGLTGFDRLLPKTTQVFDGE